MNDHPCRDLTGRWSSMADIETSGTTEIHHSSLETLDSQHG